MPAPDLVGGPDLALLRLAWVALALLFLVAAAVAFRLLLPRRRQRPLALRGLLLVSTLGLLWLALELVFAFCVRSSDGYGHTLASRLWFARYWRPVNSHGFRDREHPGLGTRPVLLVVGDSFAAGHGIADASDRFADLLAARLGDGFEMVLLARNGWDTRAELEAVRAFPLAPGAVVLSYVTNDIHGAAHALGRPAPPYVRPPRGVPGWVVGHSFLLDWVYWRVQRRGVGGEYWDYLVRCHASTAIWYAHAAELRGFVEEGARRRARLVVLVWPDLGRVEASAALTSRVAAFFRGSGVAVVDMSEVARGWPPAELVVNPFDPHPNRALHRRAADLLVAALEGSPPPR